MRGKIGGGKSHLGDLWDLVGVDGPAVLGHGHSVPGLFSRHALFS